MAAVTEIIGYKNLLFIFSGMPQLDTESCTRAMASEAKFTKQINADFFNFFRSNTK
jgi:hypothetical protein